MKKRILSIILICFSIFLFVGCSNNKTEQNNTQPNTTEDSKPSDESNDDSSNTTSPDKTISKDLRLYFYDALNDKNVYTTKNVTINNGEIVTAIVNELKNASDSYIALNPKARVSSAKVDKDASLLTVDFNNSIINGTLGGGVEASFLQAIANTLGYNLGVSNVRITINGTGYCSGHIDLGDSDHFIVGYDGWTEVK